MHRESRPDWPICINWGDFTLARLPLFFNVRNRVGPFSTDGPTARTVFGDLFSSLVGQLNTPANKLIHEALCIVMKPFYQVVGSPVIDHGVPCGGVIETRQ